MPVGNEDTRFVPYREVEGYLSTPPVKKILTGLNFLKPGSGCIQKCFICPNAAANAAFLHVLVDVDVKFMSPQAARNGAIWFRQILPG